MAKKVFRISEAFDCDAVWWAPGRRKKQVSGRLSFSPEAGARLVLHGSLSEGRKTGPNFAALHGATADGTLLSALEAYRSGTSTSIPGFRTESYAPSYVVTGGHFRSLAAVRLRAVVWEFSHLAGWLQHDPFTVSDGQLGRVTIAEWPGLSIALDDGLKLEVRAPIRGAHRFNHSYEAYVEPFVRLESQTDRRLSWAFKETFRTRELLSLLTGVPVVLRAVSLLSEPREIDPELLPGQTSRDRYELFFALGKEPQEAKIHPGLYYVPFADVEGLLHDIARRWFVELDGLETVAGLMLASLYNESLPIEFMFLGLMQALESFHRRQVGGRFVDPRRYAKIRRVMNASIPPGLPDDLAQSLRKRLEFGNDLSLRRRLRSLRSRVPDNVAAVLSTKSVERLVQTRNHLTHYPVRASAAVIDLQELIREDERLRALLHVLLLQELGVPAATLDKLTTENLRFLHLLRPDSE